MKNFESSVAFVSGANRGLGLAFVKGLLEAGATKVYAGARDVASLVNLVSESEGKVVPVELDVTDKEGVFSAAGACTDVNLVINNAGIATYDSLTNAKESDNARQEMEVNYFGALNMVRAFSPVLKQQGGGTFVSVSSIAGLVNFPFFASYSVSKAAVHSLVQGVRAELANQNTLVMGVYPGPIETEMTTNLPIDKASTEEVVAKVLEGILKGDEDVFPDATSMQISAGLNADAKGMEKHIASLGA